MYPVMERQSGQRKQEQRHKKYFPVHRSHLEPNPENPDPADKPEAKRISPQRHGGTDEDDEDNEK